MRKYYSDLLEDNSGFRRNMRNVNLKHKMLINCSIDVSNSMGVGSFKKSLPFFLASIAFPIDMKKVLKKTSKKKPGSKKDCELGTSIIKNIENAMTHYSKRVMKDFVKMPEVSTLLLNYLSKVDNPAYKGHYKMLKDMAEESISEYSRSEVDPCEKLEERLLDLTS